MIKGPASHTHLIKKEAVRLGFEYCHVARAEPLSEDARRLESWLAKGFHGSMKYMENHFDLRIDPTKLVPGAQSVIVLMLNYFPSTAQAEGSPKISKYAYGNDYHEVIREKLRELLFYIKQQIGEVHGRGFVNSAPVLERSWAVKSGLGWIGKNGNLISKSSGSFFFLSTLITDLPLEYDDPFTKDYCGTCRKCIDACPTSAITEGKEINGSKCISYFTIELKDMLIPEEQKGKFKDWMFGCDICQDVCPWNRFSKPATDPAMVHLPEVLNFTTAEWETLTEESFKRIFKHSPLMRSKYKGIQRNLKFIRNNA
jgi:epoxyqueuosine reductase